MLNFVHTHMQAWEPTVLCSRVRKSQFGQLAKLLTTFKNNDDQGNNVLVVGDFNENPRLEFAQEHSLHVPANFLKTYGKYFYDHAYSTSPRTVVEVASTENDANPSDHKAVVIRFT
jgi:endonuclease/exonuclease/phosphatase (EEP) superfamily protein YafD